MKIKVCGITSVEQLQQLQQLGADYAGLIFYEGSKRFAEPKLSAQKTEIKNDIQIKKIGVFVNADYETVLKTIRDYNLYAVQLHGDETDEFCLELMDKTKVIKVFRIGNEEGIDELVEPFQNVCDYFLFDTAHPSIPGGKELPAQPWPVQEAKNKSASLQSEGCGWVTPPPGEPEGAYGGTGKQFNWTILENAKIDKPFFLSGGIGPEDVEKTKAFKHPYLYAIDINSGFEKAPGIKDIVVVKAFISELNADECDARDDQ